MTKTLIVYHSRSGYTRRIAHELARRLDADLDEIRIVQPMKGVLGYALCAMEAIAGLAPALRPARKDPAAYDMVVVGTPVWFWSLASPVRSWLESHPLPGRRLAFFCTMGGSGAGRVFDAMRQISGCTPRVTLALTDDEIDRGRLEGLEVFLKRLQKPVTTRRRRSMRDARRLPASHQEAAA
jgi:flavodoxin